jgi:hypothetical protein
MYRLYIGTKHFKNVTMNTESTLKSYDDVLLPLYTSVMNSHSGIRCHGDNAKPHVSKGSLDWFQSKRVNRSGFGGHPLWETGGHPANSPDLNPIELVFNILDENVNKRHPRTTEQLIKYTNEEWSKISLETIQSCYERYPRVIKYLREHEYGECLL